MKPRIYVACLAAYNSGRLHGEWIDANQDPEEIQADVEEMLERSPEPDAEEWAIHDFEGFSSLRLDEHADLEYVSKLAEFIDDVGPIAAELVAHSDSESTIEDIVERYEETQLGVWDSLVEWAEDYLDDTGDLAGLPENLKHYFDYEAFARDAELGGDIWTIELNGSVHVFSP